VTSSSADPDGALGVVVHGMSRSCTSAVTGLFVASGYFVGDETDLMRANSGNPAGYYENLNVYKINEDVLAELGARHGDLPPGRRSPAQKPTRGGLNAVLSSRRASGGTQRALSCHLPDAPGGRTIEA
jgi:hypothetical protein